MSECRKCGQCCRTLWVTITQRDVKREPKLKQYATEKNRSWWLLPTPCPLLTEEGLCSIYKTRPKECRDFEPGFEKCLALKGATDENSALEILMSL